MVDLPFQILIWVYRLIYLGLTLISLSLDFFSFYKELHRFIV